MMTLSAQAAIDLLISEPANYSKRICQGKQF